MCEYCNEKFNFDIDKIDITKDKVLAEELKAEFYDRVEKLNEEKKKNYNLLLGYKKLAYPKPLNTLKIFLIIGLFFSLSCFFAGEPIIVFGIIGIIGFSFALYWVKKVADKTFSKYKPNITHYAKKVVETQSQIDYYTRIISKLIK